MTLKGGMEHAPTINIKFYACCTFQKPQEDIDSSKCHIFKWPLIIHFNSSGAEVCTLSWGPVNTEGWFLSCGCVAVKMGEGMLQQEEVLFPI